MATVYVITEPCLFICSNPTIPREQLKHRICVDVCPIRGIRGEPGEDPMRFIDPELCIGCGACWYECPVEAIYKLEDVPDAWSEYIELNAAWHRGEREKVRERLKEIAPS